MKIEEVIQSIVSLKGVYASFHSCPEGRKIVAQVPKDWTLEIAQSLAQRCIDTFDVLKLDVPDCYEARIDSDFVSLLIHDVEDGYLISLTNEPLKVGEIQDGIEAIIRKFTPDQFAPPPETSASHLVPAEESSHSAMLPVPTVTMPVTVNASQNRGGRYINEQPIGEGGTAVVCKAYDLRLNREVALKRFKKSGSTSSEDRDYLAEMESASRIRHHNVLSTFDADIDTQGRYIVMQLIDGMDLEKRIAKSVLSARFLDFAIQSLEGLHATHEAGLLHLDLKPSNIMVSEGASGNLHATLIDFGRAQRLVPEDGQSPPKGSGLDGSLHFCAPEFITSQELDVRSDIYSLGCVFYFALTGKRPFEGDDAIMVMAAHMQHMVTDIREHLPDLEEKIASTIMKMIEHEPDNRPTTVTDTIKLLVAPDKEEEEEPNNIRQFA